MAKKGMDDSTLLQGKSHGTCKTPNKKWLRPEIHCGGWLARKRLPSSGRVYRGGKQTKEVLEKTQSKPKDGP